MQAVRGIDFEVARGEAAHAVARAESEEPGLEGGQHDDSAGRPFLGATQAAAGVNAVRFSTAERPRVRRQSGLTARRRAAPRDARRIVR